MATLTDEEMAALEAKEAKRPAMTDEEMADYEALQGRPDPAVMKSRRERVVDYLKSRPAAIADTAKSLVTPGGGVDQAFAGRYLMGLPATVEAAADTAPAALRALAGGPSVGDEWRRNLAKRRAPYEAAEAKQPGAALVGSMLAPNLAGKATAGQRVMSAGAQSGIDAATHGEDAAASTGLGMGVQGVAEFAPGPVGKFSSSLRQFGRGRALATLSPGKADIAKLQTLGIADSVADDLYRSKAFGPLSTTEDVSKRLGPIVEQRGDDLGSHIMALDNAAGGATTQPSVAADRVRSMAKEQFGNSPAYRAKEVIANREADAIEKQYGAGTLSLADSERYLKRGYDDEAVKRIAAEARGAPPSPKTDAMALVRDAIKRQNEDAAEAVARARAPELAGKFVPLKQAFGRMAEAQRIADKTGGPKAANRYLSLSDYGFGIALGQAYGSSPLADLTSKPVAETLTGMAAGVAHRQLRTRGSAAAASVAYPVSAAVGAAGKVVNQSPAVSATIGGALEDYLRPKDDEERQEEGAAWLKGL